MTGASPPCFSSELTSSSSTSSSDLDFVAGVRLLEAARRQVEGVGGLRRVVLLAAAAGAVAALPRPGALVVLLDGVADRGLGGDDGLDVVARHELDVVEREDVGRIRHRDRQRRAGAADRDDLVLLGGLGRNQLEDRGVDVELGEVDEGNAVLAAEERGDLLVLDHPQLDEGHPQLAAVGLLMVQGLLQLGGGDALFAEQEFAEPNSHGCVVVAVVVAGKGWLRVESRRRPCHRGTSCARTCRSGEGSPVLPGRRRDPRRHTRRSQVATSAPDLTQVVNRHDRPSPSFAGGSAGGPARRAHHCAALHATTEAAAAARRTRERHGSSARTRAAAHTTPRVSQFEMRRDGIGVQFWIAARGRRRRAPSRRMAGR